MHIYTFRYMWRLKDSNQINFKIITDTLEGLKQFEETLKNQEDIILAGKEYLHEIDVSRITQIITIKGGQSDETQSS